MNRRSILSRLVAAAPLAGLLVAAALAGACTASEGATGSEAAETVEGVDRTPGFLNGWRGKPEVFGKFAEEWYGLPQGSQLVPFDVFMKLQTADGKLFSAKENLSQYGFLYGDEGDPSSPVAGLTTEGLPLGMVRDERQAGPTRPGSAELAAKVPDGTYLGITCAACHTGQIKFKDPDGKVMTRLIHGGQPMLDFERFTTDLYEAVERTAKKPDVVGNDTKQFAWAVQRVQGLKARSKVVPGTETGPGRLDAVTHILNEVMGHQYRDDGSNKPISVPVSLPPVWNAARLQCVQTNCLSTNSLTRNVGEVLGVFGESVTYKDSTGRLRARSTAKVDNLAKLEEALDWVQSPKWNDKELGPIEQTKAKNGAQLFGQHCSNCHAEPYKSSYDAQWDPERVSGEPWAGDGMAAGGDLAKDFTKETYRSKDGKTKKDRYVWKVTPVNFEDVGTDAAFIVNHAVRRFSVPSANNDVAKAIQLVDEKIADRAVDTIAGIAEDVFGRSQGNLDAFLGKAGAKAAILDQTSNIFNLKSNLKLSNGASLFHADGMVCQIPSATCTPLNLRKPGGLFGDGSVMSLVLLGGTTASTVDSFFMDKYAVTDDKTADQQRAAATKERDEYQLYRAPSTPTVRTFAKYRARPLNGVAFTAPYGHNGTWPTLRSVIYTKSCNDPSLKPQQKADGRCRPDSFYVSRDALFDTVRVGIDTSGSEGFQVKTGPKAPLGNQNVGHTYGEKLTDDQVDAIIEYLKSI